MLVVCGARRRADSYRRFFRIKKKDNEVNTSLGVDRMTLVIADDAAVGIVDDNYAFAARLATKRDS